MPVGGGAGVVGPAPAMPAAGAGAAPVIPELPDTFSGEESAAVARRRVYTVTWSEAEAALPGAKARLHDALRAGALECYGGMTLDLEMTVEEVVMAPDRVSVVAGSGHCHTCYKGSKQHRFLQLRDNLAARGINAHWSEHATYAVAYRRALQSREAKSNAYGVPRAI